MGATATSTMTLGRILGQLARQRGDAVALVFEGRTTTYGELANHARRTGQALRRAGLIPEARIAYLGKNSDAFFELLFGASMARLVLTPVNWRLAAAEVLHIVQDSRAKVLFVGREFVEMAHGLLDNLPEVREVVAIDEAAGDWPDFRSWRDAGPDTRAGDNADCGDVVLQLYTSGTTGRPKGAMLRQSGLLGLRDPSTRRPGDWNHWAEDDISLLALPQFHMAGCGTGLACLTGGAKGILVREFDPEQVLDFIARDRITKLFMVPSALQIVVRSPRARDIDYSCLRTIAYGASPIPLALLRECMDLFGCGFVQMYGMTETSGTIVALGPDDHAAGDARRLRAAGRALPGVEIAIEGADGAHLPVGEVGEIVTRSIGNMAGYWNMPEATRETLYGGGWLRTGDAGYLDEDGYLFIHDRVKDMIISGGENVYPAEVENAIFGHPAVAEVAVIGVPHEIWGEAVKAVVVCKPGQVASGQELIAWARARIAAFKLPKSVDFVPELPRNASGKVLRRQLREPYWVDKVRRVN